MIEQRIGEIHIVGPLTGWGLKGVSWPGPRERGREPEVAVCVCIEKVDLSDDFFPGPSKAVSVFENTDSEVCEQGGKK